MVISIIVESFLLFGIYKRSIWVVPFALFYSAITLAQNVLDLLGRKSSNINIFAWDCAALSIALFCIYQIIVFSRSETRMYFKERGQLII
jgi:uncharacterized membrane protein